MTRFVGLVAFALIAGTRIAAAAPGGVTTIRCDNLSTAELNIDGLLDDWPKPVLAHAGAGPSAAFELRCSWDGNALAIAVDVRDDKIVRVRSGRGHEDHVELAISAGKASVKVDAYPGNAIAKPKLIAPRGVTIADSLQPKGFSIELRVPARAIAGLATATASLDLHVVFHDSDAATGGADTDVALDATIELADRADLFDDLLRATKLSRRDLKLDTTARLDADRPGKQRLIAGGTIIAVLADQFAFVSLPVEHATDVRSVQLLPLGPKAQQVVAAVVRQTGNGGSRDLLMLWTVWSGQLQPLGQIEVRKQLGAGVLESKWRIVAGKKPELIVEPVPAIGLTAETWNEQSADDADSIIVPWDTQRGGIAYSLTGVELKRRELPAKKHR